MYGEAEYVPNNPKAAISKVDNGWVVRVHNPHEFERRPVGDDLKRVYKAIAKVIPEINELGGASMVRGADEEMETWKKKDESREQTREKAMQKVQAAIEEAFAPETAPQSRFPELEVRIFPKLDQAMSFIHERLANDGNKAEVS